MRKKYLGKSGKSEYDTITEEGECLQTPDETKEYIAEYYENLYQAREGKIEYQQWTNKIQSKVKEI